MFNHERARRCALGVITLSSLLVFACHDDALNSITGAGDGRITRPPAAKGRVLVGAGSIARCDGRNDEATARLLKNISGTVFTTGDNTHPSGTAAEYTQCYDESWGDYRARTRPAAGDRDYGTKDASAYFDYFGAAAGPPEKGYYSYDLGTWHVVVLNSSVPMDAGSEQIAWLRHDLEVSSASCTIAYWHYPRFSSYSTAVRPAVRPAWDVLYEMGADVVVNGHYRVYERFGPQTPDGEADAEYGVRQFTVGTGGHGADSFSTARANSEVRAAGVYGVIAFDLQPDGYAWTFVGVSGQSFGDSGTAACHGKKPSGEGGSEVAAVNVTPGADTIAVGATLQLSATALDGAGEGIPGLPMSWESADPAVASVDTVGIVTANAAGTVVVTATSGGKTGSSSLAIVERAPIVSLDVTPEADTLDIGQTAQLTATAFGVDGDSLPDQPVQWSSSDTTIATVNEAGMVTAIAEGNATVVAEGDGQSDSAAIVVTARVQPVAAVTVTPSVATTTTGATTQLTAVATSETGDILSEREMTWTSRNQLIARVTSAGLVTGVAVGSAYVIATSEGQRDSALITVQPAAVATVTVAPTQVSIEAGSTMQLTVTVTDVNGAPVGEPQISWTSSVPALATVDGTGLVRGVAAGVVTITATSGGKVGLSTVTVTGGSVMRAGHYVSANGSSGGDGSHDDPWDLATALAGGRGAVQPGDTVWLRGGTYRGAFSSTLTGTASAPIVVRQYPGERAVIDVAGATSATSRGDAFVVRGDWTEWWGFELMSSDPNRYSNARPNMMVNNASHTRYVHLVIHDGGIGFFNYATRSDVEINGCIFYNNGWQGASQGGGHGLYLKSNSGPVIARDNVMFNQFGYGVQVYSDYGGGGLVNITLDGNVAFNNGALSSQAGTSGNANVLVGGQEPARQSRVVNNVTYFSSGVGVYNVVMGASNYTNDDLTLLNNYMVGGQYVLNVGEWESTSIAGNTTVGASRVLRLKDKTLGGYQWAQNAYMRDPNSTSWQYDGSNYNFETWKSRTGLGSSDLVAATMTGGPRVFVRPSTYEDGRAVVVVYNWGQSSSVPVDLSSVLQAGRQFEIHNVQNLFGAPVASGSFGGGTVSVPVNAVTPPVPVGGSPNAAPVTGPEFNVYIVTAR